MVTDQETTIVAVPYFEDGQFKVCDLQKMKDITTDFQKGQGGGGRKYDDPHFCQEVLGWHTAKGNCLRAQLDKKLNVFRFTALKSINTSEGVIDIETLSKFQKAFPNGQIGTFIIENINNGLKEIEERKKKLSDKKAKSEKDSKKANTNNKRVSRKIAKKTSTKKSTKK